MSALRLKAAPTFPAPANYNFQGLGNCLSKKRPFGLLFTLLFVLDRDKREAFAGARKPPKPRKKRRFFAKLCPNLGKCMAAAEKVGAESGHYELPKWRTCSPV
jgi:hypothetical protein